MKSLMDLLGFIISQSLDIALAFISSESTWNSSSIRIKSCFLTVEHLSICLLLDLLEFRVLPDLSFYTLDATLDDLTFFLFPSCLAIASNLTCLTFSFRYYLRPSISPFFSSCSFRRSFRGYNSSSLSLIKLSRISGSSKFL